MKIRTRAFLALWLITILVAGTIGVIVFALNIASGMDSERQRLSEILNVHGANVYLTKPIEAAALTEEVTRLLTARR